MDMERRLILMIKLDMMTSLLLALLPELTTQAAVQHTVDVSQCPQQCSYHGDCITGSDAVLLCQCHPGWGGDACSVQCAKSCQNGQCMFSGMKQECRCFVGYHGDECQHTGYNVLSLIQMAKLMTHKWDKTMPLVDNPTKDIERNIQRGSSFCTNNFRCQNGGKCRRGGFGGYRCDCGISKHTGTFCQFTCPQACLNGGKCVRLRKPGVSFTSSDIVTLHESEARYNCVCIDGFSGVRCQKDVRPFNNDSTFNR